MALSAFSTTLANLVPFTPYPARGEPVDCDLCGAGETVLICQYDRRFKRLTTVACRRCGLIRTDPMPTEAELARYYAETYRWDYGLAGRRPSRRHMARSTREAANRLALLAPVLRPGMRILDFGSGAGAFLGAAAAAGHSVVGIEPGRAFAAYARETFAVEVIAEPWERIGEEIGTFDLITTSHVLEHLRRPVAALRWLASLLADDGRLYASVPNMTPNHRQTFRRFHFAHVHGFTPATLAMAAQACELSPDPRIPPRGTTMVFRKAADSSRASIFDRNQGEEVRAMYPQASIARYVLTAEWLLAAARRLKKSVSDTLRPSVG
jgi:2-polyprenyl-3-methyl-5-hydroxy-6-metoxy-1,4-benzoquinol methylase